jgi:hypothetical protein
LTNKAFTNLFIQGCPQGIRQTFLHLDITSWSGLSGKRCRRPNALSLLSGKVVWLGPARWLPMCLPGLGVFYLWLRPW